MIKAQRRQRSIGAYYTWDCPKCGYKNTTSADSPIERRILFCDLDEGGCDEMLVVEARGRYEWEVKVHQLNEVTT